MLSTIALINYTVSFKKSIQCIIPVYEDKLYVQFTLFFSLFSISIC